MSVCSRCEILPLVFAVRTEYFVNSGEEMSGLCQRCWDSDRATGDVLGCFIRHYFTKRDVDWNKLWHDYAEGDSERTEWADQVARITSPSAGPFAIMPICNACSLNDSYCTEECCVCGATCAMDGKEWETAWHTTEYYCRLMCRACRVVAMRDRTPEELCDDTKVTRFYHVVCLLFTDDLSSKLHGSVRLLRRSFFTCPGTHIKG